MADRARESESEQIRENIERTRSRMDETIRALDSKMSVGQILDQLMGTFRGSPDSRMRNSSRYVIDAVRENPVPAVMVGAGLAWLLYEQSRSPGQGESSPTRGRRHWPRIVGEEEGLPEEEAGPGLLEQGRSKLAETKQRLGEKFDELRHPGSGRGETVRETGGQAKAKLGELGGQAKARAGEMRDRAREAGGEAMDKARHVGEQTRQRVGQAKDEFRHQVDENPLAVAAAAFALGLLGGLFVPPSRREAALIGQPASQIKAGLREAGEEAKRGWQEGGARDEVRPEVGAHPELAGEDTGGPWGPSATEPPGLIGSTTTGVSGPPTGRIASMSTGSGLGSSGGPTSRELASVQPVDPTRPSDSPYRATASGGQRTPLPDLPGTHDPLTEAERRRAELLSRVDKPDEPWRKR